MNGLGRPSVRAVVYTRKSSEEGLDQEFNSLDAQYEACTAYIASQRHEGWKLVKQRFDDGGVSGGTMDRPALKALLDEVDKGLIGCCQTNENSHRIACAALIYALNSWRHSVREAVRLSLKLSRE